MKIVLFGGTGQVGQALQETLPQENLTVVTRDHLDFARPESIEAFLKPKSVDVIINAAAYTQVDKAESEESLAQKVNADAVAVLAKMAKEKNALLIHYSTDYVFDGTKNEPYCETDHTNPLSVYGRTKLAGEQTIQDMNPDAVILRTSWVYSDIGKNFLKTILTLADTKEALNVVADQWGVPTSAAFLAEMTIHILTTHQKNPIIGTHLYHLVPKGRTNWAAFAFFILEYAQELGWDFPLQPDAIHPIPTEDYPTPAKRPKNSCLDTQKFQQDFNLTLPDWEIHAKRVIDRLLKFNFADAA